MKRSFVLLLVLATLFALLWTYVQSDDFSLRIRPLVVAPLQRFLGPGANVGWVKANLLHLYVEVRDISVPAGKKTDAVTIHKVKAYVNPFPLLWRRISISSLIVLEPRVRAERGKDGKTDVLELINRLARSAGQGAGAGPPSFDVAIRNITLTDGAMEIHDVSNGWNVRVSRLDAVGLMHLRSLTIDIRSVAAHLTVSIPSYQKLDGRLDGSFAWERDAVIVRHASVVSPLLQLKASGRFGMERDAALSMHLSGRIGKSQGVGLRKLLKGGGNQQGPSADIDVTVSGRHSNPIVNGSVSIGQLAAGNLELRDTRMQFSIHDKQVALSATGWQLLRKGWSSATGSLQATAKYEDGAILIEETRVDTSDFTLTAKGKVDPALGYDIFAVARSRDEGTTLSLLTGVSAEGNLAVGGTLSGSIKAPRFEGMVSGAHFSIRGIPFTSAAGTLSYKDGSIVLRRAEISQGLSRYLLDGTINLSGPAVTYRASLDAVRADAESIVELFYKKLPLRITATGKATFAGTSNEFGGSAKLDLEAGSAYGESFDSAVVNVVLSTDRVSFPSVTVKKGRGLLTGSGWIGFNRTYAANIDGRGLDLEAVDLKGKVPLSGPLFLTLSSSGSFSSPVVRGHAESTAPVLEGIALGTTACDLSIANRTLSISATSHRGDDTLFLRGNMTLSQPYGWSLSTAVHLNEIEIPRSEGTTDILGRIRLTLEAGMDVSGTGFGTKTLNGQIRIPRVAVSFGDYTIRNEGNANVRIMDGTIAVESLVLSGTGTKISVRGTSGLGQALDLTVTGDANLTLMRLLTRAIEYADGSVAANVRLTGTWSDPGVNGDAMVKDGLLKIRDVPQRFSGLSGTVRFDRNQIVTEGLRGEFGGGTLSLGGTAQLHNLAISDFTLKALIENVTVRYPVGFTATVGGTLYYDGDMTSQTLSGEIRIVRARYERRVDWKSMLVDVTRGLTPRRKIALGWMGETILNVRFFGQDDIVFENNLAKIPLELDMIIQGTVNQPQVLGHVEARRGDVYFRRNVFRIQHASADFADPNKINPALDVEAETRVREYQIKLSVTGYADHAVVTFSSDPALSDANILALLTIGRRTEDIAGKEREVGSSEAISLATGPAQDYLERRARSLTGLDRFQVDPYFSKADVAVPRVTAGKELVKDKLIVTYSSNVGASTPEQMFSLEYILNRNVSLVGERNDIGDFGGDIKFHFRFR